MHTVLLLLLTLFLVACTGAPADTVHPDSGTGGVLPSSEEIDPGQVP